MIINILLSISHTISCMIISRNIIHFFQLDSYQFPSFFRTIYRNKKYSILPIILLSSINIILYFIYLKYYNTTIWGAFYALLLIILAILIYNNTNIKIEKKKFVLTNRVKRLYVVYSIVVFLASYMFLGINYFYISTLLLLIWFIISALIAWPIEKLISELYFQDAKKKLAAVPNLIKIGITGSYGKTTVKTILGEMLSEKYSTLISPKSFNTPMGLTRTIREHLGSNHRIFIAEMGSRHLGDIKELCRLVNPSIGVITSIGPQHLDTFKSVDNVTKGKYELIESLPKNGKAFFQDDNGTCLELFNKTNIDKSIVSIYNENADVFVDNIDFNDQGSTFIMHVKGQGYIKCKTSLLGEHNIKNIMLSTAICLYLGIKLKSIPMLISKLSPIKNRLEIINTSNYTIINDAFNSNPIGAKEALRVLGKFKNRKIVITPGMVELGNEEIKLNMEFGEDIANVADIVILVGKKRITPIKDGLLAKNFNEKNIYVVPDFKTATERLTSIVRDKDVVLFENDLPDNYIEA